MRQIYSRPSRRPPVFHPHTLVILSAAKKPRISSLLLLLQLPVLLPINGAVISTEATPAAQWRNPLVHLGFHQPLPCSCTAMYCSRTCRCLAVALCRCLCCCTCRCRCRCTCRCHCRCNLPSSFVVATCRCRCRCACRCFCCCTCRCVFVVALAVVFGIRAGASAPRVSLPRSGHRSAEGGSEARRAKRLIYCLCLCCCVCSCIYFSAFSAKKRMSSPQTH